MLPSAGWSGILSRGRDGRCGIGEGSGGQAFQRVYDPDSGRGGECGRGVLQPRQVSTNWVWGSLRAWQPHFYCSSVSKHQSCSGEEKATVLNIDDADKNVTRFKWSYPRPVADGDGVLIKFVYSVVQTFETYWIAQQLGYLKITPGPGNGLETIAPQFTSPRFTSSMESTQTTPSSEAPGNIFSTSFGLYL